MKKYIIYSMLFGVSSLFSCNDLDLYPLSQGTSETWYSSKTELEMSLNDGYRMDFWWIDDRNADTKYTDDWVYRNANSDIVNGILTGLNGDVGSCWTNQYKAIARANLVLANIERAEALGLSESDIRQYSAEAYFLRACRYMTLVTHFGDVPYVDSAISLEEAFSMGRTPLAEVKAKIYEDFDKAIESLPVSYASSSLQRATKGAALAMKARFALYMGDFAITEEAAKAVMDLGVYQLHSDFSDLFLPATKHAEESIFLLPRSVELNVAFSGNDVKNLLTRNAGGYAARDPSWDLLAAFLCTDGLPIDESPLFDPHDPFKNRDPRCTATIVAFGTKHLGFEYNPHPQANKVMNYNTGQMVTNNDSRVNAQYASFNALVWKKGVNESWMQNGYKIDPDQIIIRYADVLLMYAEAKIELGKIDDSVLDAINQVRARAYGVKVTATDQYPAVKMAGQKELRKVIRFERRMEFAKEGLRYMDLIRWKLATKALKGKKNYGILYPYPEDKLNNWFWPSVPAVDDDAIADFTEMEHRGDITVLSERNWNDRQYLWPIPTKEILINENLKQNPGY